jgi:hypothetical protein
MIEKVKKGVKRALTTIPTPGWTRRYPHLSRLEKWKADVLSEILLKETGGMVFGGPFSTMKLDAALALGRDPRFIVGSYEQEVHDVVNDVIASAPANVIDIGSAYGYYAVGFATKIANTRITAFEAVEEQPTGCSRRSSNVFDAPTRFASSKSRPGTLRDTEFSSSCRLAGEPSRSKRRSGWATNLPGRPHGFASCS